MATAVASSPLSETKLRRRRILVCLDRSPSSEACVPYGVALARTFGSDVTLVHVMEPPEENSISPTQDALGWEILRQEARGYLERIALEVSGSLEQTVETRLEQGRPAERIVDVAREIAADLTVIGSHGQGAGSTWNPGGTVRQVLALVQGSVFVAHPAASQPTSVVPTCILVPLDGSLRTESVLPAVVRLATAHGAELLLVHVVQEPLPTALLRSEEDLSLARTLAAHLELSAGRYLGRLQKQLAHDGLTVRTLVARHSNERQCILEISQKEGSDLIVLSAHGSACDAARSFGSVTTYLLGHAGVPLLVLQDLPDDAPGRAQDADAKLLPPSLRASYASEHM